MNEEGPEVTTDPMATIKQRFDTFYSSVRPTQGQLDLVKSELGFLDKNLGAAVSESDEFEFIKALRSGSYAKQTMVRRANVGDFDADLGIYVSSSAEDFLLDNLLTYINGMVVRVYEKRKKRPAHIDLTPKSAIRIAFVDNPKINIDVVPIVALDHPEIPNWGYIPRADGERRATSVTAHVDFVRRRNKREKATSFNKVVTLFKWWRNHWDEDWLAESFSSFALSLVLARAFDESRLSGDWLEDLLTIASWVCRHRLCEPIVFDESGVPKATSVSHDPVQIFDPYNLDNNVTHHLRATDRDAIVQKFDRLADQLQDAQNERDHDEREMLKMLEACFHNFRNWSTED